MPFNSRFVLSHDTDTTIEEHVGSADPHAVYTTDDEVTNLASPLATSIANTLITGALNIHTASDLNPHIQYVKAIYDPAIFSGSLFISGSTTSSGSIATQQSIYISGSMFVSNSIVLPKAQGIGGFQVDLDSPTYPFKDLLGSIHARGIGATDPSFSVYQGNLRGYQFSVNDEVWIEHHIPHDYMTGTNMFIHTHWSHTATTVTGGNVVWGFNISYAKGHNQAAFPSQITVLLTGSVSTTQYQHMIPEIQFTSSPAAANQVDTSLLEPDGIFLIRCYLAANNITVSGGGQPDPFLHFTDIHYQSTGIGTKNKSPNFYS